MSARIQHFLTCSRRTLRLVQRIGVLLPGLSLATISLAGTPLTFSADYEARYGSFRASAQRSLQITDENRIEMSTTLALKIFGKTISKISETSQLTIQDDENSFLPMDYAFIQTGLGKRARQIHFDWNTGMAQSIIDKNTNAIPLDGRTLDSLSAYLEIGRQLAQGNREIVFAEINKGEIQESRFRVLEAEILETSIGKLNTIRLEKVRGDNSDRHTELWLAPDWGFLLVRLIQEEPGASKIRLELKQATVDNNTVQGIVENTPAEG